MRGDDRRILAADIFHFEDVLVNSIYAFGLRSLARMLGEAPEAEEFRREADRTGTRWYGNAGTRKQGPFLTCPA